MRLIPVPMQKIGCSRLIWAPKITLHVWIYYLGNVFLLRMNQKSVWRPIRGIMRKNTLKNAKMVILYYVTAPPFTCVRDDLEDKTYIINKKVTWAEVTNLRLAKMEVWGAKLLFFSQKKHPCLALRPYNIVSHWLSHWSQFVLWYVEIVRMCPKDVL